MSSRGLASILVKNASVLTLGRNVLPLKQWGGGKIDYHWQVPSLEYWLKKHGFADLSSNLEMQPLPKPQPAPKRS